MGYHSADNCIKFGDLTVDRTKRQSTEWEKIIPNPTTINIFKDLKEDVNVSINEICENTNRMKW